MGRIHSRERKNGLGYIKGEILSNDYNWEKNVGEKTSNSSGNPTVSDVETMSEKHIGLKLKTDVGPTRIKEVGTTSLPLLVPPDHPTCDRGFASEWILIDPACFSDVGPISEKHIGLTSESDVWP